MDVSGSGVVCEWVWDDIRLGAGSKDLDALVVVEMVVVVVFTCQNSRAENVQSRRVILLTSDEFAAYQFDHGLVGCRGLRGSPTEIGKL